jgi:hypothetical protein
MKTRRKGTSVPVRDQNKRNKEKDDHQSFWRRFRLQLAAIFLAIVFLASEYATLLPVEY